MKKKTLAGLLLILGLGFSVRAQGVAQDCGPIQLPPACEQFLDSVRALDARIERLQERLTNASPAIKAGLLRSIGQLNDQRADAAAVLARCKREHGVPTELQARFIGNATLLTTDNDAAGPFNVAIDVGLRFSANRCKVTITRFPTIELETKKFPVIGKIDVEVTKTGGGVGTFRVSSGAMSMPITLHLHYDTLLITDDDATFNLTTSRSISGNRSFDVTGLPLTESGSMTLVGTTRFRNGHLAGKEGSLVITGIVSPLP